MYHNLSWKESIGKRWKMYAGISYTLNQDDIKAGMKDANKNEVILPGLNSKHLILILMGIISMQNCIGKKTERNICDSFWR